MKISILFFHLQQIANQISDTNLIGVNWLMISSVMPKIEPINEVAFIGVKGHLKEKVVLVWSKDLTLCPFAVFLVDDC